MNIPVIRVDPKGFSIKCKSREVPTFADYEGLDIKPAITSKPGWDGRKS